MPDPPAPLQCRYPVLLRARTMALHQWDERTRQVARITRVLIRDRGREQKALGEEQDGAGGRWHQQPSKGEETPIRIRLVKDSPQASGKGAQAKDSLHWFALAWLGIGTVIYHVLFQGHPLTAVQAIGAGVMLALGIMPIVVILSMQVVRRRQGRPTMATRAYVAILLTLPIWAGGLGVLVDAGMHLIIPRHYVELAMAGPLIILTVWMSRHHWPGTVKG